MSNGELGHCLIAVQNEEQQNHEYNFLGRMNQVIGKNFIPIVSPQVRVFRTLNDGPIQHPLKASIVGFLNNRNVDQKRIESNSLRF